VYPYIFSLFLPNLTSALSPLNLVIKPFKFLSDEESKIEKCLRMCGILEWEQGPVLTVEVRIRF
jgi:hypothetical protein